MSLCNIYKLPPAGFDVEPVCRVTQEAARFESNDIVRQFEYEVLDCGQTVESSKLDLSPEGAKSK